MTAPWCSHGVYTFCFDIDHPTLLASSAKLRLVAALYTERRLIDATAVGTLPHGLDTAASAPRKMTDRDAAANTQETTETLRCTWWREMSLEGWSRNYSALGEILVSKMPSGTTVLHVATGCSALRRVPAVGGHAVVMVARLVDAGADANARNKGGFMALLKAVTRPDLDTATVLLDGGGSCGMIANDDGTTPLLAAATRGHVAIASLFSRLPPQNYRCNESSLETGPTRMGVQAPPTSASLNSRGEM